MSGPAWMLPGPDPIAPPGRACATCRWWGARYDIGDPNDNRRDCESPWVRREVWDIATPPDFGCNQWEAQA